MKPQALYFRLMHALQQALTQVVLQLWHSQGHYDKANVDPFLASVLPIVKAAQTQATHYTAAYVQHEISQSTPIVVNPDTTTGAVVRNGTDPAQVYTRPFLEVWHDLANHTPWAQAVQAGGSSAVASAAMDIALAKRATFQQIQDITPSIYGYERVAHPGACSFCVTVDGAYVKSAYAHELHAHCECYLVPLTAAHPAARYLPAQEVGGPNQLRPQMTRQEIHAREWQHPIPQSYWDQLARERAASVEAVGYKIVHNQEVGATFVRVPMDSNS